MTWKHLLQQTSEWEGECFGVPDKIDRYRTVQFQEVAAAGMKGDPRPLQAPGAYWEYNDVRVNQLSLALMHLFGRPLPEIFRDSIMQPVGASEGWSWAEYDSAWIDLGGRRVQSVPGGPHWGGGLSIGSSEIWGDARHTKFFDESLPRSGVREEKLLTFGSVARYRLLTVRENPIDVATSSPYVTSANELASFIASNALPPSPKNQRMVTELSRTKLTHATPR